MPHCSVRGLGIQERATIEEVNTSIEEQGMQSSLEECGSPSQVPSMLTGLVSLVIPVED